MNKSALIIASLLAALTGSVHAQAAAPTDPMVKAQNDMRAEDKAFSDKKKALNSERNAKAKSAGDAAEADAKAKGSDPMVARRNAEAKVKAATKADYDAKMKVLKKEHSDAVAAIRKTETAVVAKP